MKITTQEALELASYMISWAAITGPMGKFP